MDDKQEISAIDESLIEVNIEEKQDIKDEENYNNTTNLLLSEAEDEYSYKKYNLRRAQKTKSKRSIEYGAFTYKYKCNDCLRAFNSKSGLIIHKRIHQQLSYICKRCSTTFASKSALSNHVRSVHSKLDSLTCPHCSKLFQSTTGLSNHIRIHKATTFYKCLLCQKSFNSNIELIAHKRDHKDLIFYCNDCESAYSDHCDFMIHQTTHMYKYIYDCEECGQTFNVKTCYRRHILTHYDKELKCTICEQQFKSKVNYDLHIKTHNNHFKCGECGLVKSTKGAYDRHMRMHTGFKPFQCLYCGKGFNTSCGRKNHTYIHTGERPYKCECGKAFRQYVDLNKHMITHGGKQFECDYCHKKFKGKQSLHYHILMHTYKQESKQLLYSCDICPKQFPVYQRLASHYVYHHSDEKNFECKICNMKFKMRSLLVRHMKSISHSNNEYGAKKKAQLSVNKD